MKKQSMLYRAVTGLILVAVFTLAGCGNTSNNSVPPSPPPPGPKFNYPSGIIAIASTVGVDLYVADTTNHTIRKVAINTSVSPGTVTVSTVAGKAGTPGKADDSDGLIDTRTSRFRYPMDITTDGVNFLYVADTRNHTIRQIDTLTGNVTTLAGAAEKPGSNPATDTVSGADARFRSPMGIAYGGVGILYVADTNNHTIRKVMIDNSTTPPPVTVSTVAGTVGVSGSTDGNGDGTGVAAQFHGPIGVAADSNSVYVGDTHNHTIRKIDLTSPNRVVTTLAGSKGTIGHADGIGTAATFFKPAGLALNGDNLFVADQYNQLIRVIDVDPLSVTFKKVTTLAGTAEKFYKNKNEVDTPLFKYPQAITTLDGTTLYIADTFGHILRKLDIIDINAVPPAVNVILLVGVPLVHGSTDDTITLP